MDYFINNEAMEVLVMITWVVLQYKLLLQNCLIWNSNSNGVGGEKFRKRCQ